MNNKMKLLTLGVIFIVVLLSAAALIVQTFGNNNAEVDPIRVACVGDSITQGTEYPADLQMLLGSRYNVNNFGKGGAMISLNSDNPYVDDSQFQDAKEFKPNIVIIMLGTNDAHMGLNQTNASFIKDYLELVSEFQGLASNPQVWIVMPPPIFSNEGGLNSTYFSQNVIPSIEQVGNKMDLPVIDVYTPLIVHAEYFPDGVHPNGEGAQLIASIIYNAIISQDNATSTS